MVHGGNTESFQSLVGERACIPWHPKKEGWMIFNNELSGTFLFVFEVGKMILLKNNDLSIIFIKYPS